jgi:hypothetical protein
MVYGFAMPVTTVTKTIVRNSASVDLKINDTSSRECRETRSPGNLGLGKIVRSCIYLMRLPQQVNSLACFTTNLKKVINKKRAPNELFLLHR